jgi:hypothetical protein
MRALMQIPAVFAAFLFIEGAQAQLILPGGGSGNVTGPSSSVSGDLTTFSGITGKVIQDSGVLPGTGSLTPLETAPGSSGAYVEQNGSISNGDCLNWNTTSGATDSGQANCIPLHPGYITGSSYWYPAAMPGAVNVSGAVMTANTVYCTPTVITTAVTIKALGAFISTVDSGGHVGWAIYTNGANHRPGTLVDYAAPASTTTQTSVNGAMNNPTDTLTPGVYWFCDSQDNSTSGTESTSTTGNASWAVGSATESHVTVGGPLGVSCLVSSTTCGSGGSGWAVWSTGTFTWGTMSGVTWGDITTALAPWIVFEVN